MRSPWPTGGCRTIGNEERRISDGASAPSGLGAPHFLWCDSPQWARGSSFLMVRQPPVGQGLLISYGETAPSGLGAPHFLWCDSPQWARGSSFLMARQPPVGQRFLISYGVTAPSGPRTPHFRGFTTTLSYTSHLVGLL
jgi:hypothetical protein